MAYRGEDLDLRTPQTWSATPADLANAGEATAVNGQRGYRAGPIWVDDTVLAVCNHAFDVALAHRAGEVRFEHVLHALTRIETAAEALEARGVRVAALRRETGTIVASEIPVGLTNGKGMPRRSDEFAEMLRLAAKNSARRNAPASIEDLLYVILDRPDGSGPAVLQRHTRSRDVETVLPPERFANRYSSFADRYEPRATEASRYQSDLRPRAEYSSNAVDSVQNARIEGLEHLIRSLASDFTSERQALASALNDLARDNHALRDAQGRALDGLHDRIANFERTVSEASVGVGLPEGSADALKAIETNLGHRAAEQARTSSGLLERFQTLEAGLGQRAAEASRHATSVAERIGALEAAVRQRLSGGPDVNEIVESLKKAVDLTTLHNRLELIEEAVLSRQDTDVSALVSRLAAIESEVGRAAPNNAAGFASVENLIARLERQRAEHAGQMSTGFAERFDALGRAGQEQQGALSKSVGQIGERLAAMERAVVAEIETAAAKHQAYIKDLTEVHEAMMKLNQNQHTLAGSIDQWRGDAVGDLAVISNSLANLDRDNERPIEALNRLTSHMDTMNKMMVERYHRRNRFWYWLFGTDDWIGASWPSQAAAMEAERQRLKAPGMG